MHRRALARAKNAARSEILERRQLLSISGPSLAGPYDVAGTHWTYSTNGGGGTSTSDIVVIGPATFMGNSSFEADNTSGSRTTKSYTAVDGAGNLVTYGATMLFGGQTTTFTNAPPQVAFPPTLSAGVAFNTSSVQTSTTVDNTTGETIDSNTTTIADTLVLASETAAPISGTAYTGYQVDDTQTTTSGDNPPQTQLLHKFYALDVGLVKVTDDLGNTELLTSFNSSGGKLAFIQQPNNTAVDDTIKPPVTVAVEDSNGNY